MESARESIIYHLASIIEKLLGEKIEVLLEIPEDSKNGDYSSSVALKLFGKSETNHNDTISKFQNPRDYAEHLKLEIENLKGRTALSSQAQKLEILDRVEVAGPGFLNFYLSKDYLTNNLS